MAKGKSTWRYNKLLTARRNYFSGTNGGPSIMQRVAPPAISSDIPGLTGETAPNPGVEETPKNGNPSNWGSVEGWIGLGTNMAAGIGSMVNNIAAPDVKSRERQLLSGVNSAQMRATEGDSLSRLLADYRSYNPLGHVTKNQLGAVGAGQAAGNAIASGVSGAAAGMSIGGGWGAAIGAGVGMLTSAFGSIGKNIQARKAAKNVNQSIDYTNEFNERSLANRAMNLSNSQVTGLEANYAAFGGPIEGAIDYGFMNSWLDSKRMAAEGKDKSLVSMPNSFAYGGRTHGAEFTNGLMAINEGGSHETNPYEGVPMGVDPEGTPNLVEEGETIFNDYVFSKRLMVPKAIREKYKLRGTKELSFADASKLLAKESDERPNDPISQNGLEALMADLASAQEGLKAEQQGNEFALGGNLFGGGGDKPKKSKSKSSSSGGWNFNNNSNDATMAGSELFSPFFSNDAFDFAAMHADNSTYRQRLDRVAGILWKRKQNSNYQYTDDEKKVLEGYRNNIRSWNNGKGYDSGIDELSYDKIIGDSLTTTDGVTFTLNPNPTKKGLALDSKRGGHYWGAAGVDAAKIIEKHMLRNPNGDPTPMPEEAIYYSGTKGGYDWAERWKNNYTMVNNGAYEDTKDEDGNTIRTYYYDPVKQKQADKYYYNTGTRDNPNYVLYEGEDDAPVWMANNKYNFTRNAKEGDVTSYFYDPTEKFDDGQYADWLRYAPAIGFGIGSITDAIGLTNKPDYSNADAILEATRTAGMYQPVKFNPIGNYLSYRPFDRDFYINKQNAEAGATRRYLLNTSAGNRATAMAGLLAADNNYINGIGALARQAEEYNLAQRQQVEDFNRGTNITNSQGMLQADTANQKALSDMREFSLKGNMAAAEMREKARLTADASRSANLSGFFQTLGDIGFEEKNARMRDWSILHGVYGPGTEDYGRVTSNKGNNNNVKTRSSATGANSDAKGGRIKRKKKRGLTI